MRLANKHAMITGAASGIGRAIAMRLASRMTHLTLVDIDAAGLERTAREARELGAAVDSQRRDLTLRDEVDATVQESLDQSAGVDLLVNNAGVTYHGPTHAMPAGDLERLMSLNLLAHVRLTHGLLPSLLARPEAHVLNVCSVLGLAGMPRVSAYCAGKFAMVGFSESLRSEYGRVGLGVTAFCPGFVRTELFGSAPLPEGQSKPKSPPAWICLSPERVARRAVLAVERNRGRVVLDPYCWWAIGLKRRLPAAFDWALSLGRRRRVERKRRELAALAPDPQTALRMKLGLGERPRLARAA
ncbi:putative oxidoreductase SadH [Pseudobythopirellula maris]|uniref:Putative oxidoreductase SadH n=1 Tax=Pseudobythopirellula maris TaxID=2527991 RepID=A0A5C5ZR79_9BACT|nr:SDR family NAD(P)-dependent oxidoreductase [Pseudobythopirellula maris]TWT89999.1 putative oxidoreductase SadH [Pseudobythopirellula maris]